MTISLTELRRIAELCMLDFSPEEFEGLLQAIEGTINESRDLFEAEDFLAKAEDAVIPDREELLKIARYNFSYCHRTDE